MQCEEDWLVMPTLHTAHGWSIARLAREFGVNWRTARRYATAEVPPGYGPRPCPAGLTEAQLAHVRRRLELCPELRATTLFREVRELGYAGSDPWFARRIRALRPRSDEVDPPLRFETGPGLKPRATGPTAADGCWARAWSSCMPWWSCWDVAGWWPCGSPPTPPGPRRWGCCPGSLMIWAALPPSC